MKRLDFVGCSSVILMTFTCVGKESLTVVIVKWSISAIFLVLH